MTDLDPSKLHVRFQDEILSDEFRIPRCYTLTHSDATGDLFLTIGFEYNHRQISGLYTRLMRDEVLAEWKEDGEAFSLHVYCHVSGGLIIGSAEWRDNIFHRHLKQVIEAFREGDKRVYFLKPELDNSLIYVHLKSNKARFNRVEEWGKLENYSHSPNKNKVTG